MEGWKKNETRVRNKESVLIMPERKSKHLCASVVVLSFQRWNKMIGDFFGAMYANDEVLPKREPLDAKKNIIELANQHLNLKNRNPEDSLSNDELIFKALSEMEISDFDLSAAMDNFNLNGQMDDIRAPIYMKYVKSKLWYLGVKNYKEGSNYAFVFVEKHVQISWDKNGKVLEKEEVESGGASGSGSQRASRAASSLSKWWAKWRESRGASEVASGEASGEARRGASRGASEAKKRQTKAKKTRGRRKNKNKNNDVKG